MWRVNAASPIDFNFLPYPPFGYRGFDGRRSSTGLRSDPSTGYRTTSVAFSSRRHKPYRIYVSTGTRISLTVESKLIRNGTKPERSRRTSIFGIFSPVRRGFYTNMTTVVFRSTASFHVFLRPNVSVTTIDIGYGYRLSASRASFPVLDNYCVRPCFRKSSRYEYLHD